MVSVTEQKPPTLPYTDFHHRHRRHRGIARERKENSCSIKARYCCHLEDTRREGSLEINGQNLHYFNPLHEFLKLYRITK
ncbi:hypothetical protein E2C01_061849 [Portunus trituberculatus]|uniref:Uncharacterized protein n=1 Tax=Portunus trituberculatus TaxID=210409 RepID=A0A5B7H6D7_PORTR|nr:hypothetical protein [Portunus trituberculatus]